MGAEFPAIEKFVATNCKVATCGQENVLGPFFEPKAKVSVPEAEAEGFTQAGGRVPFGITDFQIATFEEGKPETTPGSYPKKVPTSVVTHLRTDVAPGLATNPFAVPQCSLANFGDAQYAEPESCAVCHKDVASAQSKSSMAMTWHRRDTKLLPLNYDARVSEGPDPGTLACGSTPWSGLTAGTDRRVTLPPRL